MVLDIDLVEFYYNKPKIKAEEQEAEQEGEEKESSSKYHIDEF